MSPQFIRLIESDRVGASGAQTTGVNLSPPNDGSSQAMKNMSNKVMPVWAHSHNSVDRKTFMYSNEIQHVFLSAPTPFVMHLRV